MGRRRGRSSAYGAIERPHRHQEVSTPVPLMIAATQGEIGFDDQPPSKKMLVGTVPIYIVPRRGHHKARPFPQVGPVPHS